ncbi:MAG: GGDEF domain-containing protein [Variibacter sp.]
MTLTPHVPTLVMVMAFVTAILGTLLVCTWLQDRRVRPLLWWGATCLLTAVGMVMLGLRGSIPTFLSISVANAALILAAGMMWNGAQLFEGRPSRGRWLILPPVFWFVASQLPPMSEDIRLRIVVFSLILAAFVFATVHTFWQGRTELLVSRWAVITVLLIHGTMHLLRVPGAYVLHIPPESVLFRSGYFGIMVTTLLCFMVAFAFTLLALTKERAELHFKRAACIDPLTGLLNRRALFDACQTADTTATDRNLSVLVFDLDRFKQINDRFGHPVGDHVLQLFAAAARKELRGCDLLGRLGGEEFAAFLPGCDAEQAARAGERVRHRFADAASTIGLPDFRPTVSVGVAVASDARDVFALIVDADRAVYRAKEEGRNCVRLSSRGAPSIRSAKETVTAFAVLTAA